jgi:hypothetical protein
VPGKGCLSVVFFGEGYCMLFILYTLQALRFFPPHQICGSRGRTNPVFGRGGDIGLTLALSSVCLTVHSVIPELQTASVVQWSEFLAAQCSWLLMQRSWVRFQALPHFLSGSGSGTGSTQPLWGATWKKSSGSGLENWPRDTPLSTKVGTKFRRHVEVDQSV